MIRRQCSGEILEEINNLLLPSKVVLMQFQKLSYLEWVFGKFKTMGIGSRRMLLFQLKFNFYRVITISQLISFKIQNCLTGLKYFPNGKVTLSLHLIVTQLNTFLGITLFRDIVECLSRLETNQRPNVFKRYVLIKASLLQDMWNTCVH